LFLIPVRSLLLLLLSVLVCACDAPEEAPTSSSESVHRIVTLAPHLTELVFDAGAGDYLVGTVAYSDFPPQAKSLPRVGDSYRVDFEQLRILAPDLVLAWTSGNPPELVAALREQGFRVISLEPENLESIAEQVRYIGTLAGTGEVADARANQFLQELEELRANVGGSIGKRVFYQISPNPYFTVTRRHVIGQIIELCGGQNVFAELPGLAPAVSLESIIATDPQIILSMVPSVDGSDWESEWRKWPRLAAVRTGNLYAVNPDVVARSSLRVLAGARQICAALEDADPDV
jgi:iron complex transport system substrate-binding protein